MTKQNKCQKYDFFVGSQKNTTTKDAKMLAQAQQMGGVGCICVSVSPHLSSLGCSCHLFFGARNWSRMLYDFEFLKWQWIIINDVLTAFLCWARRIFPISIFSDNIAVKTSWIALKSVRKWSWVDAIYKIIILCHCTASGK